MSVPAATPTIAFGVDIGGSGIKGAPVDLTSGRLLAERFKIATPRPVTTRVTPRTVGRTPTAIRTR